MKTLKIEEDITLNVDDSNSDIEWQEKEEVIILKDLPLVEGETNE